MHNSYAIYTHTISAINYREYSGAGKSISRTERPSDRVEGGWQLTRKGFNLSWGCPAELNNLDDVKVGRLNLSWRRWPVQTREYLSR
jgi:hypothetical protein